MGLAAATVALNLSFITACTSKSNKLKVLVLGGSNFLGPAIVNAFINKGHNVCLFNRGITNPHLFPELKKIRGDREKGVQGYIELEENGHWDLVIDVWPDNPNLVRDAIAVLKERTDHYMFVSSVAVYNSYKEIGITESSALREGRDYEPDNYNLNKVLCEQLIEDNFPQQFTIVRPGAIVGDRDPGPFGTYLLHRMMHQPEIFAPDSNDPVQFIDASDIGQFLTLCAEADLTGHYNLVGPTPAMGYRDMLLEAKRALGSEVDIHWMDVNFLMQEMELEPFMEIPFWIPVQSDPEPGFYQIDNKKALAAGLRFTDFGDTVRMSYDSVKSKRHIVEEEYEGVFGISLEKETMIIDRWRHRHQSSN